MRSVHFVQPTFQSVRMRKDGRRVRTLPPWVCKLFLFILAHPSKQRFKLFRLFSCRYSSDDYTHQRRSTKCFQSESPLTAGLISSAGTSLLLGGFLLLILVVIGIISAAFLKRKTSQFLATESNNQIKIFLGDGRRKEEKSRSTLSLPPPYDVSPARISNCSYTLTAVEQENEAEPFIYDNSDDESTEADPIVNGEQRVDDSWRRNLPVKSQSADLPSLPLNTRLVRSVSDPSITILEDGSRINSQGNYQHRHVRLSVYRLAGIGM